MSSKPYIHMLSGFPSCGKTTYIHRYMNDYIRICIQDIITMLKKDFDPEIRAIYRKIEMDAISLSIEHGKKVVLDRTNLDKKTRSRFVVLAKKLGVDIKLTYLEVPRYVFLSRNHSRPAKEQVPENVYEKFQALFEVPTLDEGFKEIYILDENFELLETIH